MPNINRDYLVVIDVKSGNITAPSMYFYNTDKNTSNIYVQLVVKETTVDATPIENATNYIVEAKIVKPGPVSKELTGVLVNDAEAIYEFDLPNDCTNLSGSYKIEFWVKAKVNDRDEMITSSKAKYTVKPSILTDLDEAIEDHDDYPLFLKLMEEVRVINDTAHELDTTIRTLQADMIEANNEMKTNEEQRKANEATRVANEEARVEAERTRVNQEVARVSAEATREANENTRIANENERKTAENNRVANENVRATNENERIANEASRVATETTRVANEEIRQTNEANREAAEEIRKANEEARITAENVRVAEHEQMRTELNEVKAENAVLMENDKKIADRMTQVEISDKRQYVIMEGLMNSAGDGYLKIEDTGNDTTLYNSVEGFVDVKNIVGNTMVNSIKNPDDEFTLNADINTSGQSVTLTTAVDNGQVDVLAEGNTMVNVCDQQEAVAITKSYTVETGNHIALQGEFDGKARPVPTGNTLVNLVKDIYSTNFTLDGDNYTATRDDTTSGYANLPMNLIYELTNGKTYTAIIDIKTNTLDGVFYIGGNDRIGITGNVPINTIGIYKYVFTYDSSAVTAPSTFYVGFNGNKIKGTLSINKNILILEGDYTNKPIPDYFTGMQSSFEDKLVTQEMVDSGEELAENLGKYRVDYKVTGKNKFDKSKTLDGYEIQNIQSGLIGENSEWFITDYIPVIPNTKYRISGKANGAVALLYDSNKNTVLGISAGCANGTITIPSNARYIRLNGLLTQKDTFQLEEGSTATTYEPYKESIKTYYLNSPLLEGDTIEDNGNDVYHVHRYTKVVLDGSENWDINGVGYKYFIATNVPASNKSNPPMFCDSLPVVTFGDIDSGLFGINYAYGIRVKTNSVNPDNGATIDEFKTWLQSNPITVVYQLASPQYELISQSDTILTDSYVAGHLDFDSAVPVEKVQFKENFNTACKYIYPSTEYIIQFESDNNGKIDTLHLAGSNSNTDVNVVKGINKFRHTTDSTLGSKSVFITGIGFNASNIVVTEATDKDFGYFSGMKSVGELEENKIEILSTNSNLVPGMEIGSYSENGEKLNGVSHARCTEPIYIGDGGTFYAWMDKNGINDIGASGVFYYALDKNKQVVRSFNGYEERHTLKKGEVYIIFRTHMNYDRYNREFKMMISTSPIIKYIEPQSNKKQILLNEPLRAVGDTKDRFVQIDGKWYVERNCAEVVLDGSIGTVGADKVDGIKYVEINLGNIVYIGSESSIKRIKFDKITLPPNNPYSNSNAGIVTISSSIRIRLKDGVDTTLETFADNPITAVYKKTSPTYEPVEIAPTVNTYTDVTHITNNSTIPMNMNIKNSGYEIITKPSTKYTVVGINSGRIGDSTIVNGTITTPATITDNFLRPYGTGKTSKVMLLEGEPANIPGYFKGIKSVFEDKVTEDGKYAVEVKVIGKNKVDFNHRSIIVNKGKVYTASKRDLDGNFNNNIWGNVRINLAGIKSDGTIEYLNQVGTNISKVFDTTQYNYDKFLICVQYIIEIDECLVQVEEGTVATEYEPYHETKQTLYLDEPLYIDNKLTVHDNKLGYWKNWGKVVLDGSDDEGWVQEGNINKTISFSTLYFKTILKVNSQLLICDKLPAQEVYNKDIEGADIHSNFNFHLRLNTAKLSTLDVNGFKQYLSQNPLTVVYQLAEPVFVPLIDNCPNWIIGSWDNCSIHFDSIIPLAATRYRYTGNVPSVVTMSEDVAETKSISDEQDAMIVDLATEVAVMEMMLM